MLRGFTVILMWLWGWRRHSGNLSIGKVLKFYIKVFMRWARRCQASYSVCRQFWFAQKNVSNTAKTSHIFQQKVLAYLSLYWRSLKQSFEQLGPGFIVEISWFQVQSRPKIWSIFHGCMVWIERSVRRVTDQAEWCRTVIPSDRFFYPHHTPMIDTFSCIPFDLPHLIFKVELAMK